MNRVPRERPCPVCREPFTPKRIGLRLTKCCLNAACVLDYAQGLRAKDFDKQTKVMKRAANDKDKSFWQKKAQAKFNEFIRERDKNKPCISCWTTKPVKYDAGHYVPRGRSSALAFNELNCHKQCSSYCNVNMSGNLIAYRSALVELYGIEKVEWLEGHHDMPKYRIEDYKLIYAEYNTKLKELKK